MHILNVRYSETIVLDNRHILLFVIESSSSLILSCVYCSFFFYYYYSMFFRFIQMKWGEKKFSNTKHITMSDKMNTLFPTFSPICIVIVVFVCVLLLLFFFYFLNLSESHADFYLAY